MLTLLKTRFTVRRLIQAMIVSAITITTFKGIPSTEEYWFYHSNALMFRKWSSDELSRQNLEGFRFDSLLAEQQETEAISYWGLIHSLLSIACVGGVVGSLALILQGLQIHRKNQESKTLRKLRERSTAWFWTILLGMGLGLAAYVTLWAVVLVIDDGK